MSSTTAARSRSSNSNINMPQSDEERFAPHAVLKRLEPFTVSRTSTALVELSKSVVVYVAAFAMGSSLLFGGTSWTLFCASIGLLFLTKMRLFVQFHDMGHNSFFPSIKWNRYFGHVIGSLTNTPFDSWRGPHSTHHIHLAKVDKNQEQHGEVPTWKVEEYAKASPLVRWIYRLYRQPIILFGVLPQYVFSLSYRWVPDGLLCNMLIVLRCVILYWLDPTLLWVEFFATALSNSAGFYLFYGQHTFNPFMEQSHANYSIVKAGIYSSSYFVMHPVLHWFSANIGYHHIHHVTVRVPSYDLIKAHLATEDLWEDVTRVNFADVWKNSALALWDSDTGKYVTFAEAHKKLAVEGCKAE